MASRKFLSCRHTSWFQTLPAGPRCCRLPLWQGLYMNHMQQLRPVIWSLIVDSAKAVVHVFISCRLDYYNSLLTGVTDGLLCRLSSWNAAVRLVLRNANTSPRYGGSCAGCQFSLQRIHYKLATITFRALSGEAPVYLGDGCQPVANSGWRTLKSAEQSVCNSTFGDRSVKVAGTTCQHCTDTFRRHIKTVLFSNLNIIACRGAFVTFRC